ncbi:MAG TPA: DUF1798 family protein [Bacillota bacterium]|nr:DUF1798 family protein [Bacillota bacterium]
MTEQQLMNQTHKLMEELDLLKECYFSHEPPKSKNDKHFFLMVKEKTQPIYQMLETWEEEALHLIKERKADVHPQQITSTRENMELLLLHSFYIDVKRKRYMELNHSVTYIFNQLLRDLARHNT